MANMTFKANLLPSTNLGYSLGSSDKKWKINGYDDPKLTDTNTTYSFTSGSTGNFTVTPSNGTAITISIGKPATAGTADNADKVDNIHARGFLRNYYTNTDLSSTELINTDNYLYSVGDSGGWATTTTKPSGIDNAFGILHCHLHSNNYAFQLGFGGTNDTLYYRSAYSESTFKAWRIVLSSSNYTSYTVTKTGDGASGTWGINITGSAGSAATATSTRYIQSPDTRSTNPAPSSFSSGQGVSFDFKQGSVIGLTTASYSGVMTYRPYAYGSDWSGGNAHQIAFNNAGLYWRQGGASWGGWSRIWRQGDSVTGAVWNDYAEYRESHIILPGYVVQEVGDDTLQLTTQRLDHFAGVTSDTWGFAQGETEKAKTPIAVAGRVLVYPGEDRNSYKPGDCVCAGPNGKVYIMTREEVRNWPDRIVGTVSCVPDYEMWGGGEGADRDPVKVNGRIWIKVK